MNTANSKTTDLLIPVRGIVNGMIELDNKEKVAGVKVTPRNIFILDEAMQFSVIDNLKNFYNTLDFEFWLVVADRPVDISVYLAQLQALYNSSQDSITRKLVSEDLKKANDFAKENVTDVEFYILFKEKNVDNVQKKIRIMINGLAAAGLVAAQANNEDLRTLLDNFLNGGVTTKFGTVMA
ncbi:MAG TPA: hypothetical protein PKY25_00125 [Bacilli bacterium]|nr:hypothetical protein [Bacilli bacterium]